MAKLHIFVQHQINKSKICRSEMGVIHPHIYVNYEYLPTYLPMYVGMTRMRRRMECDLRITVKIPAREFVAGGC